MHICHLALYMDSISSVLLDLCDVPGLIPGQSRDSKLGVLWSNYHTWCETTSGFFGFQKKKILVVVALHPQKWVESRSFCFPMSVGVISSKQIEVCQTGYLGNSLHRIFCALATDQNFAKFHRKFAVQLLLGTSSFGSLNSYEKRTQPITWVSPLDKYKVQVCSRSVWGNP